MKIIDGILDDLKIAAKEYAAGEISKEEFGLHVDLLLERVDRIEIDFVSTKIHTYQRIFNQLLFQAKFRATEALEELKRINSKVAFNAKMRRILATKLCFKSLHKTIEKNAWGYSNHHRYKLKLSEIQIFIEKQEEGGWDHGSA